MRNLFLASSLALIAAAPAATSAAEKLDPAIARAIADPRRSEANRARDKHRHPAETLAFFGVKSGQTIVEFYPGGGWYTEILAPAAKGRGRYIAMSGAGEKARAATRAMLDKNTSWFGPVQMVSFDPAAPTPVPSGSADRVLTFRNVHNLLMAGDDMAAKAFAEFYRMLKPGGILGVVDHHLPETMDIALERKSGYVKRSTIVRLATAAGFRLSAESPINANPKDSHDWPEGVWTLPPTYARGEAERELYREIGESDRVTLRFVKPTH